MISSNSKPMKTQIVRDSLAAVFFPAYSAEARKSGAVNGRSLDSRLDFQPRLEPIRTKRISAREPASRNRSALPASLEDWLASDAALVIRRKSRAERKTPAPAALTPVAVRV